jgi:hypothetical protein
MQPRNPANFASGETLDPTRINNGFQTMLRDLVNKTSKRYCYSSFRLGFTGMASSATADLNYLIKAPYAWEIVGIELVAYAPTAGTATSLSFTNSLTGAVALTCTPGSSTARGYNAQNIMCKSAANTEQTFSLAVTGAGWTLGKTVAIVHIRTDRGNAGVTYSDSVIEDALRVGAGETVDASQLNTVFTAYETKATANTNATNMPRIQVFTMRPVATSIDTADRDWRIPESYFNFHSMDVVSHGASGDDVTFTLLDAAGSTVTAVTVNGSGSVPVTSQGNSINASQSNNRYTDSTKDYIMRISRDASAPVAIPLAYAVLYYV